MDNKSIIKQLEKALEKEDKELRLRVEVLVDMMKEYTFTPQIIPPTPVPEWPRVPQPTVTYESDTVSNTVSDTVRSTNSDEVGQSVLDAKKKPIRQVNPGSIKGSGGIVSNGEQIIYSKPKGL